MKNNKRNIIDNLFSLFTNFFFYFRWWKKIETVKSNKTRNTFLGKLLPKTSQAGKEGNVFLLLCSVIFLFSISITAHSFFTYHEKIKRFDQLVKHTDQVEKDNLLIQTFGEDERRKNLLSLAVDYGYAHAGDLVVYINYPNIVDQNDLTLKQVLMFGWKYFFFVAFLISLYLFRKNLKSFYFKNCKVFLLRFLAWANNFLGSVALSVARENTKPNCSNDQSTVDFSGKVKIISDSIGQVKKKSNESWWKALFDKKEKEYISSKHYLSYSSFYKRKTR